MFYLIQATLYKLEKIFIKNYDPIVEDYQKMINVPENSSEEYYVAYGEASIDCVLKEINKQAKSDGLDRLLENMSVKFYNPREKDQ